MKLIILPLLTMLFIKTIHAENFYNFEYLEKAKDIIKQTDFIPESIKKYFVECADSYDRAAIAHSINQLGKEVFLEKEIIKVLGNERQYSKQILDFMVKQDMEKYQIAFDNVGSDLKAKGQFANNLFDAFFYHLYGIGKKYAGFYSEQEAQRLFGNYPPLEREQLINKLKQSGFLQSNAHFEYDPSQKLRDFMSEHPKGEITTLIIAGGHVGLPGLMSISRFKNALTIDLSPLQAPDIIIDINDPDFLNLLYNKFENHFALIKDTSNVSDAEIFKPATLEKIIDLIRPGGELVLSTNSNGNVGVVSDKIREFLASKGLTPLEFKRDEHGHEVALGRFRKN